MNDSLASPTTPIATARQLTPPGRGGVAVLQLIGEAGILDASPPLFRAANRRTITQQPVNRLCFGHWGESDHEEVIVCRTSFVDTEIHCHGGSAAIARILGDLAARGVDTITGHSTTERSGRPGLSPIESECRAALIAAPTRRTAGYLLTAADRLQRSLRPLLEALRCASPTESAMTRSQVVSKLEELLRWSAFGRHLVTPWSIVIVGRPNVGKSTLMNALLGYARSIVFDQPGTTRDVVTALSAIDGWPVEFADTAGIRDTVEAIESDGIRRAWGRLEAGDVTILLLDSSQPPTSADRDLLARCPDALVVAHKADLPNRWGEPLPSHTLAVSSHQGVGIDELFRQLSARLVPELPTEATAYPVTLLQSNSLTTIRDACISNRVEEATTELAQLTGYLCESGGKQSNR